MSFSTIIRYGIFDQGGAIAPSFPISGLTAYYNCDSTGGTTLYDSKAGYDGTVNSTSIWDVSGKNNGCIDPASSYYGSIGSTDSNNMYTNNGLSISMWYYAVAGMTNLSLVDKGGSAGNRVVRIFHSSDSNYRILLGNSSGAWSYTSIPTIGGITLNAWNHVVLSATGGTGFKVYSNGSLQATITSWTDTLNTTASNGFIIGALRGSTNIISNYFNDKIDEVAFYNRPITQTEVETIYNSGTGIFY